MSTQLSWLPEVTPTPKPTPTPKAKRPKPPPEPDKASLWGAGLYNLMSLTGLTNGRVRNLLGKLDYLARRDRAGLVELIERCVQERPDEPVPWLIAGARKLGEREADAWGLVSWYATAPDTVRQWPIEDFEAIMSVSGMEPTWRGALGTVTSWIEDGYRPDSIFEVMAAAPASAHDWTAQPVYSLRFWDGIVRRRAARWDPARAEYRSG